MKDTLDGHLAFARTKATDIFLLTGRLARRPHMLQIIAGEVPRRALPLTADVMVVGRAHDADIRIMTADLSRRHMRLSLTRRGFECRDLDSRNGVYVNAVQVESAILRDGDHIQLGNVVFEYHEGS